MLLENWAFGCFQEYEMKELWCWGGRHALRRDGRFTLLWRCVT